ncbi:hypothetical protein PLICRDRAFT_31751 [Plicaturopsis crispa FD-325 SS-3]|nr:hypothetical protein PLICRDRAFT_31751 [Plicaturopsis crispa FD-325 SS-3]
MVVPLVLPSRTQPRILGALETLRHPHYLVTASGTKDERAAARQRKSVRKRAQTFADAQIQRAVNDRAKALQAVENANRVEREKISFLDSVLESLASRRLTIGDLMLHVFDPVYKNAKTRWEGFFRTRGTARRILDLWASKENTPAARKQVHDWAVDYTARAVRSEAKAFTDVQYLQTITRPINAKFVQDFDMTKIHDRLMDSASVTMSILNSFATSVRQLKSATPARMLKKSMVVTSAALQLLGEYSYANNFVKRIMGLYFFATGTQRQSMTVVSHLGLAESYSNLTAKPRKKTRHKKRSNRSRSPSPSNASASRSHSPSPAHQPSTSTTTAESADAAHPPGVAAADQWLPDGASPVTDPSLLHPGRAGTLRTLSESMMTSARSVAATGLYATVYDNINMVFRAAEQIMGRTDSQENGTCATIWPLWKARLEDMRVADLTTAFDAAPPLSITDIVLNEEEAKTFHACLIHCVLRIIITHGGEKFAKFSKDLDCCTPVTPQKIEVHRTPLHPINAFEIDESTIVGNANFVDTSFDVLWIKRLSRWLRYVKIFAGDQLSIARLRSIVNIRAGHEGGYEGFGWGVWMPGLFHAKIADMHGFFVTHWGKPNAGTRNPGCLAFHNTVLHRHPILLSSLPPFRKCRDLVFVSLYARVLHLLLLVSHQSSLDSYADSVSSWGTLEKHAAEIVNKYASSAVVADMRWRRQAQENAAAANPLAEPCTPAGDMILENAILFLRDALISREFTDAIKCGDSGRVVLVLKTWAIGFRGNGRTKYAHEMLHLCHNISHVWPKGLRDIVFNNWLLNPTGRPNAWVEVDLMQEHMNYWIKNFYQAHGSSASWEWLGMIGPCVSILRYLVTSMNMVFGSYQGNRHATLNLTHDIPELMRSLSNHEVYAEKGRILDDDDAPTVDVMNAGMQQLTDNATNPLHEYNRAFCNLQARRRLSPIVGDDDIEVIEARRAASMANGIDIDTLPSGQQDDGNESDDSGDESDDCTDRDVDGRGEFIVDDNDIEPTLSRDNAEDVSLDMDAEDLAGDEYDDFDHEYEEEADEDERDVE